jgi:hypothetical protein
MSERIIRCGSLHKSVARAGALMAALVTTVTLAPPRPVAAGAALASLTCTSLPGRQGVVTIHGEIPGDYDTFDLKIKKGKAENRLTNDKGDLDEEQVAKLEETGEYDKERVVSIIKDFRRGVFTLALRSSGRYDLRLYAVPRTVRVLESTSSSTKAAFEAMLMEAPIPNESRSHATVPIRMRCTYDYAI